MKKNEHDIAIIGGFPPPIGGISVHIERLIKRLECSSFSYILYNTAYNNIITKYKIFNIKNLKLWLIKYFFICKDKLIHCQINNWYLVFILCLIKKIHKRKLILTLHSFRDNLEEFGLIKRFCFLFSVKNIDMIISVGENEKKRLIVYGCSKNKIKVLPAYINPNYSINDDMLIPQYVWNFMNKNDFNISANAFKICFYRNEDLYGIDMCIELCYMLKQKYHDKKIGFIFSLPCIDDQKYYNKLKAKINKLNINNEFLFVNEIIPLYPILKKCDLFLRPTNTDSYGVSIAEALYYKTPSIASDVCERPSGTIIFKSRNIDELYKKTISVINNYNYYKESLNNIEINDYAEELLNIYYKFLNNKN